MRRDCLLYLYHIAVLTNKTVKYVYCKFLTNNPKQAPYIYKYIRVMYSVHCKRTCARTVYGNNEKRSSNEWMEMKPNKNCVCFEISVFFLFTFCKMVLYMSLHFNGFECDSDINEWPSSRWRLNVNIYTHLRWRERKIFFFPLVLHSIDCNWNDNNGKRVSRTFAYSQFVVEKGKKKTTKKKWIKYQAHRHRAWAIHYKQNAFQIFFSPFALIRQPHLLFLCSDCFFRFFFKFQIHPFCLMLHNPIHRSSFFFLPKLLFSVEAFSAAVFIRT